MCVDTDLCSHGTQCQAYETQTNAGLIMDQTRRGISMHAGYKHTQDGRSGEAHGAQHQRPAGARGITIGDRRDPCTPLTAYGGLPL